MAIITGPLQDIVEKIAWKYCKSNRNIDRGDLIQEGLLEIFENMEDGKELKYYATAVSYRMLRYIREERKNGVIFNTRGGDRKSKEFQDEQASLVGGIKFVSLESISRDVPEYPVPFGRKTSVPTEDNYSSSWSENDDTTDKYLKGYNV